MFNLFKKPTVEDALVLKTMEFINSLTSRVPFKSLILSFKIEGKGDLSYFILDDKFYLNPHNLQNIEIKDPKSGIFCFNGKFKNLTELSHYEYIWFAKDLIKNEFDKVLKEKLALYKL